MMNDDMISVIQAHADGKIIQARIKGGGAWNDVLGNYPCWNFANNDYRVKPEPPKPREWWICPADPESRSCGCVPVVCDKPVSGLRLIHVREILEES